MGNLRKNLLSFTGKIGLVISLGILILSAGSAYIIYREARNIIVTGIRDKLKDVGRVAINLFDEDAKRKLRQLDARFHEETTFTKNFEFTLVGEDRIANTSDDVAYSSIPEQSAVEIMNSMDYLDIVNILRKIRMSSTQALFPNDANLQPLNILRTAAQDIPTIEKIYIISKVPLHPVGEKTEVVEDNAQLFYGTDDLISSLVDADYLPAYNDGRGNRYPGNPIGRISHTPSPSIHQAFLTGKPFADKFFRKDEFGQSNLFAYTPVLSGVGEDASLLLAMSFNVRVQQKRLNQMLQICISAVFFSLIISLIITYFIATWVNRPIKILAEGAWKVTQRDFSTKLSIESQDEMGRLAQSFNLMVEEIDTYSKYLTNLNKAYERFVPKEFLLQLDKNDITEVNLGDQVEKEMSVLFSDIRSFTALSESMTPDENFQFLNDHLNNITPLIQKNDGFIERFIGDAIVALFPKPESDIFTTSISIHTALKESNRKRMNENLKPIEIGIGLHSGRLVLGTIGEKNRMNSTVISDAVKISSDLESLTKKFRVKIIASETILKKTQKYTKENHFRMIGVLNLGKDTPEQTMSFYEVYGLDSPQEIELKEKTQERLTEAITLMQRSKKNLQKSLILFKEIYKINPADTVAQFYIDRCKKLSKGS